MKHHYMDSAKVLHTVFDSYMYRCGPSLCLENVSLPDDSAGNGLGNSDNSNSLLYQKCNVQRAWKIYRKPTKL